MKKLDATIFLVGLNTVFFMMWQFSGEFPFFRDYAKTNAVVIEASAKAPDFPTTRLCPDIVFRYSVGAESFTSRRFGPKTMCAEKDYVDRLVAQFPPGKSVDAWYDKKSPRFAVLSRKMDVSIKITYVAVIFTWAIGSVFFVWCLLAPNPAFKRDSPRSGRAP